MTEKKLFSIKGSRKEKALVEHIAEIIFTVCAFFAVLAVISITAYMFLNGTPALFQVGITDILFGTVWKPAAGEPSFGILYIILTSIVGTAAAVVIGAPIGVLTAVFIEEIASPKLAAIVKPAVELLAGIPSVIYGLLGIYLLNPLMYKIEMAVFPGFYDASLYWRSQPDLRGDRPGDHDPAYGDQRQCFRPSRGSQKSENGGLLPWALPRSRRSLRC